LTTLEQRNTFTTVSSNGFSSWSESLTPLEVRTKGAALPSGALLLTGLTGSTANFFSKQSRIYYRVC